MDSPFTPLPSVEALELSLAKKIVLEPIRPLFFVPKLDNRPQDPIIEATNFRNAAPTHPSTNGRATNGAPVTNGVVNEYEKEAKEVQKQEEEKSKEHLLMWLRAARREDQGPAQVCLISFSHHLKLLTCRTEFNQILGRSPTYLSISRKCKRPSLRAGRHRLLGGSRIVC